MRQSIADAPRGAAAIAKQVWFIFILVIVSITLFIPREGRTEQDNSRPSGGRPCVPAVRVSTCGSLEYLCGSAYSCNLYIASFALRAKHLNVMKFESNTNASFVGSVVASRSHHGAALGIEIDYHTNSSISKCTLGVALGGSVGW